MKSPNLLDQFIHLKPKEHSCAVALLVLLAGLVSVLLWLAMPSVAFLLFSAIALLLGAALLFYRGVKFIAQNTPQTMGRVEGWNVFRNEKVWETKVYTVNIDPKLEKDTQWVFIKSLEVSKGRLIAIDEKGKRHAVDIPEDILEAVSAGIDIFDCVIPTRVGRNGTALTSEGKKLLKKSCFQYDASPIEEGCACMACKRFSQGAIRHFLLAKELYHYELPRLKVHFFLPFKT